MALGRGLESLIPQTPFIQSDKEAGGIQKVSIDLLKPNPDQPRVQFDQQKLNELADSIKNYGIIEPLLVVQDDSDFKIVAGERRWRAAELAGLKEVPIICMELTDKEILETAIIENVQREDLNVIELAKGYQILLDEFNYTHEELAKKIGVHRSSLTNTIRILNLPEEIQQYILEGKIAFGAARPLLGLDDKEKQLEIAEQIIENNLNVREVEKLIKNKSKKKNKKEKTEDPYIKDLENKLSSLVDAKVQISKGKKKGKIEIFYSSTDHLNDILKLLGLVEDRL